MQMKLKFLRLNNVKLLETISTLHATIMNYNLVTNIRTSSNPAGMKKNMGTKRLTMEETVKGLGHSWCDLTQLATIFGFSRKEKTEPPMIHKSKIRYWYTPNQE